MDGLKGLRTVFRSWVAESADDDRMRGTITESVRRRSVIATTRRPDVLAQNKMNWNHRTQERLRAMVEWDEHGMR